MEGLNNLDKRTDLYGLENTEELGEVTIDQIGEIHLGDIIENTFMNRDPQGKLVPSLKYRILRLIKPRNFNVSQMEINDKGILQTREKHFNKDGHSAFAVDLENLYTGEKTTAPLNYLSKNFKISQESDKN